MRLPSVMPFSLLFFFYYLVDTGKCEYQLQLNNEPNMSLLCHLNMTYVGKGFVCFVKRKTLK